MRLYFIQSSCRAVSRHPHGLFLVLKYDTKLLTRTFSWNGGRGNCELDFHRYINFNSALATPITSLRYVLGRAT